MTTNAYADIPQDLQTHYEQKARKALAADPWAVRCRACGSARGKACYGNGDMPKRLSHPERMKGSQLAAIEAALREAAGDDQP